MDAVLLIDVYNSDSIGGLSCDQYYHIYSCLPIVSSCSATKCDLINNCQSSSTTENYKSSWCSSTSTYDLDVFCLRYWVGSCLSDRSHYVSGHSWSSYTTVFLTFSRNKSLLWYYRSLLVQSCIATVFTGDDYSLWLNLTRYEHIQWNNINLCKTFDDLLF
jgi:hypothetical protein